MVLSYFKQVTDESFTTQLIVRSLIGPACVTWPHSWIRFTNMSGCFKPSQLPAPPFIQSRTDWWYHIKLLSFYLHTNSINILVVIRTLCIYCPVHLFSDSGAVWTLWMFSWIYFLIQTCYVWVLIWVPPCCQCFHSFHSSHLHWVSLWCDLLLIKTFPINTYSRV